MIILPPPTDFGAPEKFTSWRKEQVDAIMRLSDADARHACFNMPTGSGKSLVAAMAGTFLGLRTLVLTSTKALQDQIVRDQLTQVDLRGQSNYECLAVRGGGPLQDYGAPGNKRVMVDRGPCHVGVHCWMKFNGCRYFDDVRAARNCGSGTK